MLMVSHTDLDGIAAVILSKFFRIPVTEYLIMNYGEEVDENNNCIFPFKNHNKILVTDFSISENIFNFIKDNYDEYLIFDHHVESIDLGKNNRSDHHEASQEPPEDNNIFFSTGKSGTKLYYEYLIKNKRKKPILDEFVNLVDVYDLWKLDDPLRSKAEDLNRVFWGMLDFKAKNTLDKYKLFIKTQLQKLVNNKHFIFTDYEKNIIQKQKEREAYILNESRRNLQIRTDNRNKKFGLFIGSSKISQTCSSLLNEFKNLDYIICVNNFQNGKPNSINGKVSVRSKGFDVGQLGGINGHKEAGGGSFNIEHLKKLMKGDIVNLKYKRTKKE